MKTISNEFQFNDTFLIEKFYEFYDRVMTLKQRIINGEWMVHYETTNGASQEKDVMSLRMELVTLLEKQKIQAQQISHDYWIALFEEALYIMVGLGDEIFLNIDWFGKDTWNSHLLESHFFQSHISGDQFFVKLESFLDNSDPIRIELARIYLLAISLGFEGKYKGSPPQDQFLNYKQRLFTLLYNKEPALNTRHPQVFPEAYMHTFEETKIKKIQTNIRQWLIYSGIAILVMTIVTGLIWFQLQLPLIRLLETLK